MSGADDRPTPRAGGRRGRRWGLAGLVAAVAAGALTLSLGGCGTVGYLAQSAKGHLDLMRAARPVPEVIADPATPAPLRAQLQD